MSDVPVPSCSVYLRPDAVIVMAAARLESWLHISCEPVFRMPRDPAPASLGRAVLDALAAYRTDVPDDTNEGGDEMIRRTTGLANWTALERGAVRLSVDQPGGSPAVTAWRPHPAGGMEPAGEPVRCASEPLAVGTTVLKLAGEAPVPPPFNVVKPKFRARPPSGRPTVFDRDDAPVAFGYKVSWLAVSSDDPAEVARVMGLARSAPSIWREGVRRAHQLEGVFVAPAIEGWTLVVNGAPEVQSPKFVPLLERLSAAFGETQAFDSHRIVGYYAWAKAEAGRLVRSFGYLGESGEFLADVGARTPEEVELELGIADVDHAPREGDVLAVATRWSLNPLDLGDQPTTGGPGFFSPHLRPQAGP